MCGRFPTATDAANWYNDNALATMVALVLA
jgi:hypothetical protein